MKIKGSCRFAVATCFCQMFLYAAPVFAGLDTVPDAAIAAMFTDWDLGINGLSVDRHPVENWDAAKSKAVQPGWAKWVSGTKSKLDHWMMLQKEDPTKPVGWAHDYIDPKTGAFLRWTADSAAPPAGTSEKVRAAWALNVRAYNIAQMLEAARLYRLTGDIRYRDWAASQLDMYAVNYKTLPLQTWWGKSHLFLNALDESVYSFQLIEIVRLLRSSTPKVAIDRWQSGLFEPMLENLIASSKGDHNIAVWIAAAIGGIGVEFDMERATEFALRSDRGMTTLLNRGVSTDFFWYEMSLNYQDYVVSALANFLYAARIRGLVDPAVVRIGHIALNLMVSPLAIRFANMDRPMLNDSVGYRKAPDSVFWGSVWRVLPTKIGMFQSVTQKSWDNLVDTPPSFGSAIVLPPVISQRIDGLNAVQLISDDWQVLIRYGQRSTEHSQQESLAYDLQFKGVWLFRDPGTVSYGSPLHAGYFKRAPAQNVPLINRDGQVPWPSQGEIVLFEPQLAKAVVVHRAYQKNNGVTRSIQVKQNDFLDQVTFNVGAKKLLPVGLVFNTRCSVMPDSKLLITKDDTLGQIGAFKYWTNRREFEIGPNMRLEIDCNGARFALWFAGLDLKALFLASTPDTEKGVVRTGIYVETKPVAETVINVRVEPLQ